MSFTRDIRMAQDFLRVYCDLDGLSEADLQGLAFTYQLDEAQTGALQCQYSSYGHRADFVGLPRHCQVGGGCERFFSDDFNFLIGGADGRLANGMRNQALLSVVRDTGRSVEDRFRHLESLLNRIQYDLDLSRFYGELRGYLNEFASEPSPPEVRVRAIRLLWEGGGNREDAMATMGIYRSALLSGDYRLVEAALNAMMNDGLVWSPADFPAARIERDSELSLRRIQSLIRRYQAWRRHLYDQFIGDLRSVAETHPDEGVRNGVRAVMENWSARLHEEHPGVEVDLPHPPRL